MTAFGLPRRAFRVRYCGPAEYALRVLAEPLGYAAVLAVLQWMVPLAVPHPFTSWPPVWRAAVLAALCALSVLDVALLRLRPKGAAR